MREHWHVWLVTVTLIVAAVIDGWKLKVPNLITFPLISAAGSTAAWPMAGKASATACWARSSAWALLLPAYAIGGMGAGDVKLLAGVGAWVWSTVTLYAFCVSAVVGGVIALAMVLYRKSWRKHRAQFEVILTEILTIRDPNQLSAIAAERKSSMLLLPYGIPIAIGTISYFAWTGMLL